MLLAATISYLIIHIVHSVLIKDRRLHYMIRFCGYMLILFSGAYSYLWDVEHLGYYLLFGSISGQILFIMSLFLSKLSIRRAFSQLRVLSFFRIFIKEKVLCVISALATVFREELLWRCTIQSVLGNSVMAVIITSVSFYIIHLDLSREVFYISHEIELLVFSFLLGFLFFYFESFYLVAAVHFFRNINIRNIEFQLGRVYDSAVQSDQGV